jgi:hypothetical protein
VSRVNVFSMEYVELRGDLLAYWQRTWKAARRLELWRINPAEMTWRLARDVRHAMIFFYAMILERY